MSLLLNSHINNEPKIPSGIHKFYPERGRKTTKPALLSSKGKDDILKVNEGCIFLCDKFKIFLRHHDCSKLLSTKFVPAAKRCSDDLIILFVTMIMSPLRSAHIKIIASSAIKWTLIPHAHATADIKTSISPDKAAHVNTETTVQNGFIPLLPIGNHIKLRGSLFLWRIIIIIG